MRGLSGRRVVLTGGASGIGRATAIRLAEEGCRVGILDIDEAAVAEFEADVVPVDFLANIAGWDLVRGFLDTDVPLWDKIIAINLYGPLHLHHVVPPGMLKRGFGRVVNVSSDAGRVGFSGEAVYSACKGGIIAFTKTMAREVTRKGVSLNVLCPGPTDLRCSIPSRRDHRTAARSSRRWRARCR
jgi:2-hydroxycyclohexanecarboxyl-CoA dehydrogenase